MEETIRSLVAVGLVLLLILARIDARRFGIAEDEPITFLYYPQEIRGLRTRLQNVPAVGIRDAIVYAYQWSIKQ